MPLWKDTRPVSVRVHTETVTDYQSDVDRSTNASDTTIDDQGETKAKVAPVYAHSGAPSLDYVPLQNWDYLVTLAVRIHFGIHFGDAASKTRKK